MWLTALVGKFLRQSHHIARLDTKSGQHTLRGRRRRRHAHIVITRSRLELFSRILACSRIYDRREE